MRLRAFVLATATAGLLGGCGSSGSQTTVTVEKNAAATATTATPAPVKAATKVPEEFVYDLMTYQSGAAQFCVNELKGMKDRGLGKGIITFLSKLTTKVQATPDATMPDGTTLRQQLATMGNSLETCAPLLAKQIDRTLSALPSTP
jgi:hypothetical protein